MAIVSDAQERGTCNGTSSLIPRPSIRAEGRRRGSGHETMVLPAWSTVDVLAESVRAVSSSNSSQETVS